MNRRGKCKYGFNCYQRAIGQCRWSHPEGTDLQAKQIMDVLNNQNKVMIFDGKPHIIGITSLRFTMSDNLPPGLLQKGAYFKFKAKLHDKFQPVLHLYQISNIGKYGDISFQRVALRISYDKIIKYIPAVPSKNVGIMEGTCSVQNGWKKITGINTGLRQLVNQTHPKYPMIYGSSIEYFVTNRSYINITKIDNQSGSKGSVRMFGTLKQSQDDFGIRFVPFDKKMDEHIVVNINNQLKDKLDISHYSFIIKNKINKNALKQLSQEYHFRGVYEDWLYWQPAPIIRIGDKLYQNNLQTLIESVLHVNKVKVNEHSYDVLKCAEDLIKNQTQNLQEHKNHLPVIKNKVKIFTVDSKATKDFDDAFSLQVIDAKAGRYFVGIYISDVAEYIKKNSYLDNYAKQVQMTQYIRDNRVNMLPNQLSKFFSLNQNQNKLVCSLFFQMNQQGLIDYSTIRFQQNKIQIDQNINYDDFQKLLQAEENSQYKILARIFSKREKIRKKLDYSKRQSLGMVENISTCAIQIFNFILLKNQKRIKDFKLSIHQKLRDRDVQYWIAKIRYQNNKRKLQNLKQKIDELFKKQKQMINKVDKNESNVEKHSYETANQIEQEQIYYNNLERQQKFIHYDAPNSFNKTYERAIYKNQETEFNEFQPHRQYSSPSYKTQKQTVINSLKFIKILFEPFNIPFNANSIQSIKKSFSKLQKNRSPLFISYIERIKIRNYKYFNQYKQYEDPEVLERTKKLIDNQRMKEKNQQSQSNDNDDEASWRYNGQYPIIHQPVSKTKAMKQLPNSFNKPSLRQNKISKEEQKQNQNVSYQPTSISSHITKPLQLKSEVIEEQSKIQQTKTKIKTNKNTNTNTITKSKQLSQTVQHLRKQFYKLQEGYLSMKKIDNTQTDTQSYKKQLKQLFNKIQQEQYQNRVQQQKHLKQKNINIQQIQTFLNKYIFNNSHINIKKIKQQQKQINEKDLSEFKQIMENLFSQDIQQLDGSRQLNQESIQHIQSLSNYLKIKWTNPIRQHESMSALRLIKQYKWIFQGKLPIFQTVINFSRDFQKLNIDKNIIKQQNFKRSSGKKMQTNVKNANIDIDKLNHIFRMKQQNNWQIKVLIVSNVLDTNRMAFHPVFDEIMIVNYSHEMKLYSDRKGRLIVQTMFPLTVKVQILNE